MAGVRQEKLEGMQTTKWIVGPYQGKSKYLCHCKDCGYEKIIDAYQLKHNDPRCENCLGISNKGRIDLVGKHFGDWTVEAYADDKKWLCRCSCGVERIVPGSDLRNGKSTSCGHSSAYSFHDLTGMQFNSWKVLSYNKDMGKFLCECQCENHTRRYLTAYQLKNGLSKSCGHDTTGFKDLTGMTFGRWKVLHKAVNQPQVGTTMWTCQCKCENKTIADVSGHLLRSGKSKSCGCISNEIREETTLEKYGVRHAAQIGTTRTQEQLDAISSKENLTNFINKLGNKPKTQELADALGLDRASTMMHLHNYHLEDLVDVGIKPVSGFEDALNNIFPGAIRSCRTILDGKEIDLYYPDVNIGLEFNGNYWHSELKKDKFYHQQKSLEALKVGTRIIHVFEYEWRDLALRKKILAYINTQLFLDSNRVIHGRDCKIDLIDENTAKEFANEYHIQNHARADVYIGCFYKDKLVGLMSFGRPRFTDKYQYEMIRLCWKSNIVAVGGAQKLFKYFIDNYNPQSIISYCDISKFSGTIYTNLGFKYKGLSEPSYKWVKDDKVLTRFQTMKKDLVAKGLGTEDETEEDIMHNLGFLKVYDCGNAVFTWEKQA
ncbi:MAG: hypothetical protein IJ593_10485 [Lachnospiraceae bacterium]|nr:hypothetical protein [Lachnospiraceae bacterium]